LLLVDKLRNRNPDIALTTDIIVGFPGETEEDFAETLDVVRRVGYDSAYTFIYSRRTGTPAAAMEQNADDETIKEWFNRLLSEIHDISDKIYQKRVGQIHEALIEEVNEKDPGMVSGRLSNNVIVHLPGEASLVGSYVDVKLVSSKGFYYLGEMVRA
ncbi:MAG: TRAM domain-containing protein, partial [Eubacterium sp.]|nr:TRAM domain-containing protein [Eubacterium sp.]